MWLTIAQMWREFGYIERSVAWAKKIELLDPQLKYISLQVQLQVMSHSYDNFQVQFVESSYLFFRLSKIK